MKTHKPFSGIMPKALLLNNDSTKTELYNRKTDQAENNNLAEKYPALVSRLGSLLLRWHKSLPE